MPTKPWRPAKAIDTLRGQINALAPNRSKASDGIIGDAAHAKTKSDHNPNKDGVVLAFDITHDAANGCDANIIAESLIASRDERIQYIIWNRRICNREVSPWAWRPYNGSNPHTKHLHLSLDEKPALYDDPRPWHVKVKAGAVPAPTPVPTVPLEPPPVKPEPPSPKPRPIEPPSPAPAAGAGAAAVVAVGGAAVAWGWIGAAVVLVAVAVLAIVFRKKIAAMLGGRS